MWILTLKSQTLRGKIHKRCIHASTTSILSYPVMVSMDPYVLLKAPDLPFTLPNLVNFQTYFLCNTYSRVKSWSWMRALFFAALNVGCLFHVWWIFILLTTILSFVINLNLSYPISMIQRCLYVYTDNVINNSKRKVSLVE